MYGELAPKDTSVLWLVIVGFIVAFVLAFGIGANDVANSFGTSVGAKVLTLFQACIIASIFELGGAILIGSAVSDTVRKGIIDINAFNGSEKMAMAGAFSALTGTSVWLMVATFFNLPVSGTHSIVGATIGYALVAFKGPKGVSWATFGKIAASWVISPLMSGIISSLIFIGIDKLILAKEDPLTYGIRALPLLFAFTIGVNLFSIFLSNGEVFGMGSLTWYEILGVCIGASVAIAILVVFFIGPWLKRRIINQTTTGTTVSFQGDEKKDDGSGIIITKYETDKGIENPAMEKDELANGDTNHAEFTVGSVSESDVKVLQPRMSTVDDKAALTESQDSQRTRSSTARSRSSTTRSRSVSLREITKVPDEVVEEDDAEAARAKIIDDPQSASLFKFLQVLTASFGAFAHGGNDVSNAIGPVITLWLIYQDGELKAKASFPIWILIYGGVGIIAGLCIWGRRVIQTIGENLSPITPSSGFAIEIGSALTVLLASNLGIPVSTTHCKVGSVVVVGRVRSKEVVDWSLFGNIVLSWVVTMPVTGGISAAIYAILREAMGGHDLIST